MVKANKLITYYKKLKTSDMITNDTTNQIFNKSMLSMNYIAHFKNVSLILIRDNIYIGYPTNTLTYQLTYYLSNTYQRKKSDKCKTLYHKLKMNINTKDFNHENNCISIKFHLL